MEAAQVCDRLRGEETCPFHKGHKIASLCKTCEILVCMKCVMSFEHDSHSFKEIASSLSEPTDNLAKHITEIEKRLIIAVDQELSEMKNQRAESAEKHTKGVEQINNQRKHAHLQIDTNADSKVVQWDEHSQQILGVLDKHILGLESLRSQLNEERKECAEILQKGSNILKFDAGLEIKKKIKMQRIPKAPSISELEYIKCDNNFDELLLKAMGVLKEVDSTQGGAELMIGKPQALAQELINKAEASSSEIVKHHQYQSIESISNTNNNYIEGLSSISPSGKNSAWACHNTYLIGNHSYFESKKVYLISPNGKYDQKVDLDTSIYGLQIHPITKQLFSISDKGRNIRSIDTTCGKTTIIAKCPINIHRLKVTHDNHVIVGSKFTKEHIYKYKLTGEFVKKSPKKYSILDIDYCSQTNRVAISRGKEGITLLNPDLVKIKTYNMNPDLNLLKTLKRKDMDCSTAIFDSHANLIVADYSNKEIFVLDGESLSYIQKLEIDGITRPHKLKLYDNILWVTCTDELICVSIT